MVLVKLMRLYTPGLIKKKKLKELFCMTAEAFQSEMPELGRLSYSACLSKYAEFTRNQAERFLNREETAPGGCPAKEMESRLYQNSYQYGKNLKKHLHIMSHKQAMEALQMIYRLIEVDFRYGNEAGAAGDPDEFVIRNCFFSRYYSEEICRLISSLDAGLAAGLTGGRLSFSRRITDGSACCRGRILHGGAEEIGDR